MMPDSFRNRQPLCYQLINELTSLCLE